MSLDTGLVFAVSLVGITMITALVVMVNLFSGREDKQKNQHKIS